MILGENEKTTFEERQRYSEMFTKFEERRIELLDELPAKAWTPEKSAEILSQAYREIFEPDKVEGELTYEYDEGI